MGHQVQLVATTADFGELERAIVERWPDALVFSYRAFGAQLEPAQLALQPDEWLTVCLVRASDVTRVRLEDVSGQSYQLIDTQRSPTIDVSRCYHDAEIIRPGRMFFEHGYYEGSTWTEKDEDFVSWAKKVLALPRRRFEKYEGYYVGPQALEQLTHRTLRISND